MGKPSDYRIKHEQHRDNATGFISDAYVVQKYTDVMRGTFFPSPTKEWVNSTYVYAIDREGNDVLETHKFSTEELAQQYIERALKELKEDEIIPYKKPKKKKD